MVAERVHDLQSFQVIYHAYRHRFTKTEVLYASIRGGNLHAFMTLYKVSVPFTHAKVFVEAFLCPNLELLKYIVDNIPFKPASSATELGITVANKDITPAHLQGYMYLLAKDGVVASLFSQHHVMRLCNVKLFQETYGRVTVENRQVIIESISTMFADNLLVFYEEKSTPKQANLEFIEFLEHVLKACAMSDEQEMEKITAIRTRVKTLTSTLTPAKETALAMLGYVDWIDRVHSRGVDKSAFEFIIQWNDLELTSYLLEVYGFASICSTGSLAQVKLANSLPGNCDEPSLRDMFGPSMNNKNVQVLKYLYDLNIYTPCSEYRLLNEDNLETIKFLMESQPYTQMHISKSFLCQQGSVEALRYLATTDIKWIDDDVEPTEDGEFGGPHTMDCKSLEMMQYLVDTNHDFDHVVVRLTSANDLPMIELYHRHLLSIISHDDNKVQRFHRDAQLMMHTACVMGLLPAFKYLHPLSPDNMTAYFNDQGMTPFIDLAFASGHMDIVQFILANRKERFQGTSWTTAGESGNIDTFEYVRSHSDTNLYLAALEGANRNGNLSLVKYITTKYPEVAIDNFLFRTLNVSNPIVLVVSKF
eukprot:gene7655-8959_t